ncbi:M50 family metallopeptidase [Acidiferrimicrobium sp. IK]|uniref:site-2 protease family protein n=1 Tax=Acidiferrimicrobium sp. IK TaxID=2871700 RepID=UPI0021CB7315|nr:M50 family metallopeptidase [Acidiferrimicrobium sp. IK]MCU4185622.1 M50 family metallopeptidase [Acidiferrimicrobium sp. IK]
MRDSLRLGRIGGVGIGIHWSLIAIVVLVGAGLARNRLPFDAPGYSAATYDLVGAATAVGLIGAVLLHEFGHAIVARRAGMRVDGITLSWMGGITRIDGDTRSPAWEAAIAGIGPAVSLAVGGLFAIARIVVEQGGTSRLAVSALGWLAVINVSLAVFNLIPASPLDGGRVLHAGLWKLTHDQWRATRITSRIGIGFGALVVAFSFLLLLRGQGGFQALVLAFLGYWLMAAARSEEQAGTVRRVLDGATVSDIMRPVGGAPGWITVQAFVDAYDSPRPGWVWLLEGWGGGYQAVVSGDRVRSVPLHEWGVRRPIDLAVPVNAVAGASPGDDALATLSRTGGSQIILVVDGGHTIGAVLPSDVEAMLSSGRRTVPGRAAAGARAH